MWPDPYTRYIKNAETKIRCTRGKLHGPFYYLSRKVDGKTKLTFVRRADEEEVEGRAYNYKKYIKAMADLGKLNTKIYDNIKKIKGIKTKDYERRKV